jgi:hypothetical protein
MRWLRLFLLIVGWLLTPLVVWAASVCGAWAGARAGHGLPTADQALAATVAGGVVAGFAAVFVWMRLLRRSPRLRHSLGITREGIPIKGELIHAIHEVEEALHHHPDQK